MSSKTNTDVIIAGKVYTLSGYESEAYLQKVAAYINNKQGEFDDLADYRRFPADMKATLLELNIADDYFKARNQAEKLEEDLEARNKEIYDLKHELISAQIKLEALEKSLAENEKENKELLLSKARLETELKDARQKEARSGS
jgi:cell division protein ZapA